MLIVYYLEVAPNIGRVLWGFSNKESAVESDYPYIILDEPVKFKECYELFINLETKEVWYEPIPKTEEELLKGRVTQLEQLVADLASLQLGV